MRAHTHKNTRARFRTHTPCNKKAIILAQIPQHTSSFPLDAIVLHNAAHLCCTQCTGLFKSASDSFSSLLDAAQRASTLSSTLSASVPGWAGYQLGPCRIRQGPGPVVPCEEKWMGHYSVHRSPTTHRQRRSSSRALIRAASELRNASLLPLPELSANRTGKHAHTTIANAGTLAHTCVCASTHAHTHPDTMAREASSVTLVVT